MTQPQDRQSGDTALCPVCGDGYASRGPTPERRRIASALWVQRHALREHGMDAAALIAASRFRADGE